MSEGNSVKPTATPSKPSNTKVSTASEPKVQASNEVPKTVTEAPASQSIANTTNNTNPNATPGAQPVQADNEETSNSPQNQETDYSDYGADSGESAPSSYTADPVDQKELMKLVEEEQNLHANKEGGKLAAQAVATYFGGGAGNAIAGAVNDSGIADPIYEAIAEDVDDLNKVLPGGRAIQDVLRKADQRGVIKGARTALSIAGSKGGGAAKGAQGAGQAAGQAAAKEAGKTAAKEAGEEAAKQAGKNATGEIAGQVGKEGIKDKAKDEI